MSSISNNSLGDQVTSFVANSKNLVTIPVTNSNIVAGISVTDGVERAVANVLIPAEVSKDKPKYLILSTTAHCSIDTKFEGKAAEEYGQLYGQIVAMVEADDALNPDQHADPFNPGKPRPWWTNFSDRYVFYYNEEKEKIKVPFSELTFGLQPGASEQEKKAKKEEFAALMEKTCDLLRKAGRMGKPSSALEYGSYHAFTPRGTQPLQIMSMGSKKKDLPSDAINSDTIDKLIEARKKQIEDDSRVTDKDKAKKAIDERKGALEALLNKATTNLKKYSSADEEKPYVKNFKERVQSFDKFAAMTAVIMAPLPEEIEGAKDEKDDGVHTEKETERLRGEWARAAQATKCRQILTDALVDVKNGDGVYDKRANWKKKAEAPFVWIKEKTVGKYQAKDVQETEKRYIDYVADLITKEQLDSYEYQLSQRAIHKEHYHMRWTEMVGPLTVADMEYENTHFKDS